jgi:hypothetical protein
MTKVLVNCHVRGCWGDDDAGALADAEGPIRIGGRWTKVPYHKIRVST